MPMPATVGNVDRSQSQIGLPQAIENPGILALGGIPMFMPPNGTVGNNGALSALATALDQIYSSIYLYFQAGALYAGSAAGFYYAVMSSTSAALVYNNFYVSGTPQIPANLFPIVATGSGAYVQTTGASVNAHVIPIPPNSMGPNGGVFVGTQFRNNNSAGAKVHGATFGGTTILSLSTTVNQSTPAYRSIVNRGATNIQNTQANGSSGFGASAGLPTALAFDTTVVQNFATQLQLAVATDWAGVDFINVQTVYGA